MISGERSKTGTWQVVEEMLWVKRASRMVQVAKMHSCIKPLKSGEVQVHSWSRGEEQKVWFVKAVMMQFCLMRKLVL